MHTACTPHSNCLSDCNSTAASRSVDVLFCSHFNVPSCSRCLHSRVNTVSIYTLCGRQGLFLTVFITLHCQFKCKKNKNLNNSQSDFRPFFLIISRTFSLCNFKFLLKALPLTKLSLMQVKQTRRAKPSPPSSFVNKHT